MATHQLILCLGGNLGNKAQIFSETSDWIENEIGIVKKSSPIYETPPWGFKSKNRFWNQVLAVETDLEPMKVLQKIRAIENHFGRKRKDGTYLSRKMDIDILLYDDLIVEMPELTIPHKHIAQRRFVLAPLHDILPHMVHPGNRKTVAEMLEECADKTAVKRLDLSQQND
jgi:2-amino-4-hydroxy-6-hydroxymethyldihydropteridine diphosphokinase